MQLSEQEFFYERAFFNSTFAIHKGTDQVLYRYQFREHDSLELMTDRIQYLFLELTNARHALEPDATILEKFCYALHNMENLQGMPEGFEGELFQLLFESAEIATFTPKEKIKYEFDMATERDIRNQIAFAEKKGIEKGMEKGMEKSIEKGIKNGREEGIQEERQRILEALRKQGVPEDILAKAILAAEGQ